MCPTEGWRNCRLRTIGGNLDALLSMSLILDQVEDAKPPVNTRSGKCNISFCHAIVGHAVGEIDGSDLGLDRKDLESERWSAIHRNREGTLPLSGKLASNLRHTFAERRSSFSGEKV